MSQINSAPPVYDAAAQNGVHPQDVKGVPPQQPAASVAPSTAQLHQGYVAPQQPQLIPQGFVPTAHTGPPRPWENPFFSCAPADLCCKAYWCPCFVYGKARTRMQDPSLASYNSFNAHCLGWYVAAHFGLSWVLQMLSRGEMRAKYNLQGSGTGDCCRSFCCGWREVMQEEKELAMLTQRQMPLAGPGQPQQQGYEAVKGGMVYETKQL